MFKFDLAAQIPVSSVGGFHDMMLVTLVQVRKEYIALVDGWAQTSHFVQISPTPWEPHKVERLQFVAVPILRGRFDQVWQDEDEISERLESSKDRSACGIRACGAVVSTQRHA